MKKILLVIALLSLSSAIFGGVTNSTTAFVEGLRVEGTIAFIGFKDAFITDDTNGGKVHYRVWVDLNTPEGKTAYATAMTAFTMDLKITVRGWTQARYLWSSKIPQLYDIYLTK